MNDDELKKLWRQQPLRDPASSPARVISAMQSKTTQLRHTVVARDAIELLACAVISVIFGIYFFIYRAPIARLGDVIVIGGAMFIAWKLVHARRTTPPAPPGATVVESLRAELKSVRAQSGLLGSVLWWYLLPLTVGELVFIWGGPANPPPGMALVNLAVTLVVIAVNAWVYWLNQRARAKQLLPLEAQLQSLLHSAETGEPLEETHVASLRPIVLSMAAADRVRPVEFKVAFWQIAIYGVPGIVGIWFFLMVGLAMDDRGWKTKEPVAETSPPTVRAEETNRHSLVARRVVDLLNTGDYAAVEKLFNPAMSEALPLPKSTEFFTDLATQFGNIEKFDGPTGRSDGWVLFRLNCQRGALTMSLALDVNDNISGIIFRPAPGGAWNIEGLIPRIFSWPHLLWLVPFFLAGLLYSRLLQKRTARAVGISALGVHLGKGQNLILWDEIKEVRILRILNIRSLWLIRESGEKTIMPWTSLERHSDLKAAVEGFAPADHPIHKYLSLLKRIRPK